MHSRTPGIPHTTVYYHTSPPWADFPWPADVFTVGIARVPERSALETCRRELSEDPPFGIGALLVVSNRDWKTAQEGCVIDTVEYGNMAGTSIQYEGGPGTYTPY